MLVVSLLSSNLEPVWSGRLGVVARAGWVMAGQHNRHHTKLLGSGGHWGSTETIDKTLETEETDSTAEQS